MEPIITRIIENLILPPGLNIMMVFLGLVLVRRFYRTGVLLVMFSFFTLIILSMPITAQLLNYPNKDIHAITDAALTKTKAKAIIVLGGGRYSNAPEFKRDTVSNATLVRIRYGAYLHRKSKLPLLVTGGNVYNDKGLSEAKLMQQSLKNDFNVTTKWLEEKSKNTKENAQFSFELLKSHNISNIILVTDASHIKRSETIFKQVGFTVTTAPLNFDTTYKNSPIILSFIPQADGLRKSQSVLREYLGQLWYWLRY